MSDLNSSLPERDDRASPGVRERLNVTKERDRKRVKRNNKESK